MSSIEINNKEYMLGPDIKGNNHKVKELQTLILNGLLEIDRICRKNNIPYALGFGSALGLVNYQGFIPWDDDADVVINYFDIPRFIEAFKKDLSDKYALAASLKKSTNVLSSAINDSFNSLNTFSGIRIFTCLFFSSIYNTYLLSIYHAIIIANLDQFDDFKM